MAFWNAAGAVASPASAGYVTAAPQQEASSFVGTTLVVAAAFIAFGPIASAEYIFGTHAQALYNAEAAKTRFRQALVAKSGSTPRVPYYASAAAPQVDPLAFGRAAIFSPLPATISPLITPLVTTANFPQSDPYATGSSSIFSAASQSGGGLKQYQRSSVDDPALYNAEAGKSRVWAGQSAGLTPASVSPSLFASDPNAAALYAEAGKHQVWPSVASAPTTGRLGVFATAAPQSVDLSVQPFVDAPQFNPQGWLLPWVEAEPQSGAEYQPAASITPQSWAHPGLPLHQVWADPQHVDLTLPALVIPAVAVPTQGPTVRSFTAGPQPLDLTLPAQIQVAVRPTGPIVRGFVTPPLPVDLTLAAQIWRSVPTAQPVAPYTVAAPQSVDLTLAAQIRASRPAAPVLTNALGSFVLVPAQRPDQAAGAAQWSSAQPAPSRTLGAYLRAAPWLEPWQPAPLYWRPVLGTVPRIGLLGAFVAATPDDKELQSTPFARFSLVSRTQPSLFGWAMVIALPQLGVQGVNVVVSALSQAGVEGARSRFLANSACFVSAAYFDINNKPFVPSAVQYRIDDLVSEANIVPWTPITPGLTNLVVVTSAQNLMISLTRKCEAHQILFQVIDGAGDVCYARCEFDIVQTLGAPT
jgi:hypothetical protein